MGSFPRIVPLRCTPYRRRPRTGGLFLLKDFLRQVSLFADLDEDQLGRLAGLASEVSYPANHILFREGDPVDSFYLVREGGVTVFRDTKGKPIQLLARLEE